MFGVCVDLIDFVSLALGGLFVFVFVLEFVGLFVGLVCFVLWLFRLLCCDLCLLDLVLGLLCRVYVVSCCLFAYWVCGWVSVVVLWVLCVFIVFGFGF